MTTTTRRPTRPATITADNWRSFAACREVDPELFFPLGTSGFGMAQTAQAKAVCRRCPAAEWCLQWAVETREDFGVWGGLSEDERLNRRGRTRSRRRVDGLTITENILQNRLDELRELEESGLGDLGIAQRLGTNVQTILRVRDVLAKQASQAPQAVNA